MKGGDEYFKCEKADWLPERHTGPSLAQATGEGGNWSASTAGTSDILMIANKQTDPFPPLITLLFKYTHVHLFPIFLTVHNVA